MISLYVLSLVCMLFSSSVVVPVLGLSKTKSTTEKKRSGGVLCEACIDFMDQAIEQLLQIIANAGVLGSCEALCNELPNSGEALVCNLLCDYVGIEAFIDLVNDTDPDPVWICMELDVCPINNHFSGSIVSFTVAPTSGPQGTTFTFSITYTTLNNSGTADLAIVIEPSDAEAFGDDTLFIGEDAGTYQTQFSLQAVPNESEPFNPGVYQTVTALCEGDCGCTHSHCFTVATKTAQFTITN